MRISLTTASQVDDASDLMTAQLRSTLAQYQAPGLTDAELPQRGHICPVERPGPKRRAARGEYHAPREAGRVLPLAAENICSEAKSRRPCC